MTRQVTDIREGAIVRLGTRPYRVAQADHGTRLQRFWDRTRPVRLVLETCDALRAVKERELPYTASLEVVAA